MGRRSSLMRGTRDRTRNSARRLHRFDRWMYRSGRPNRLARLLNRISAIQFSAGILAPNHWVTLEVPGRRTGRLISFPLVVADYEGERYLVAMLGQNVNWVRNVRAAGGRAVLRHGRREPVPTSRWTGEPRWRSSTGSPRRSRSFASPPIGRTRGTPTDRPRAHSKENVTCRPPTGRIPGGRARLNRRRHPTCGRWAIIVSAVSNWWLDDRGSYRCHVRLARVSVPWTCRQRQYPVSSGEPASSGMSF